MNLVRKCLPVVYFMTAKKIDGLELKVQDLLKNQYSHRSKENIKDLQAFFAEVQFADPQLQSFSINSNPKTMKLPNDFESLVQIFL
jgi:hypothetical protein